jgi:hypothetical protein
MEGTPMTAGEPRMIAMQSYLVKEREGIALDPGKH